MPKGQYWAEWCRKLFLPPDLHLQKHGFIRRNHQDRGIERIEDRREHVKIGFFHHGGCNGCDRRFGIGGAIEEHDHPDKPEEQHGCRMNARQDKDNGCGDRQADDPYLRPGRLLQSLPDICCIFQNHLTCTVQLTGDSGGS